MESRARIRTGPKVIHRHRVGGDVFRRVSELFYVGGCPRALLDWFTTTGGLRSPLYVCELDPARLTKARGARNTFYYAGETVDPRYETIEPAAHAE